MNDDDRVSVLLVDDQPARLLSYEAILGDLGLELVAARSGAEALQRLMEREFAAILLDVNMPDMDGFETAALIHRHPRFEKTPIIFVTAVHVTDLDRLKGYQLGAFDYVYVPVVPEILRSKVQVLAELHAQGKKLQQLNRTLEQANAELAQANTSLQAERARELQSLNETLERANAELAQSNTVLLREVAERQRVEAALQDADRRKNEFLATLSHELRNPLAAIASAVRLVQLAEPSDPRLSCAQDVLARQVGHLIRLIDDLLDISRITRGRITLRKEPVELAAVIARAVEAAGPLVAERQQRLAVRLPDEPLGVDGDPVRLAQVVANLLTNAVKYTPAGGRIDVIAGRAAPEGEGAEQAAIRVKDTGMGIAPEVMPRIFELFSQAEPAVDHQEGGLGIGLALVREIVSLHGGCVEAASSGVGQGAEFVVRLPLAAAPAVETRTPADRPAGTAPTRSPHRVLLVDDNRDSAESLAAVLRMLGHDVEQANDGPEALGLARARTPDLVLLDIGLPGMNGYEVARRLRAEPALAATTLIALTGYGSDEDRRESRAAGFDGHLIKPIDFDDLERILCSLPASPTAALRHSEAA